MRRPSPAARSPSNRMTLEEFHDGLRALMNLDFDELVKAGAFHEWQADAWQNFRRDPFRSFFYADEETADIIWEMMQARQSQRNAA